MNFINNKYTKWYNNIISSAKARNVRSKKQAKEIFGYSENHHIIPRSIGGSDLKENMVFLTAKEHFCVHLLLVRMTSGMDKSKLLSALWGMANQKTKHQKRHVVSGRTYEWIKRENANNLSEKMMGNSRNKGVPKSKDHKEKLSEYRGEKHHGYGKKRPDHSKNMSGDKNPMSGVTGEKNPLFGKKRDEIVCLLIKDNRWDNERKKEQADRARKNLSSKKICPHCLKEGSGLSMYRYHFNNCKKAISI